MDLIWILWVILMTFFVACLLMLRRQDKQLEKHRREQAEETQNYMDIEMLIVSGHTYHCACRIVWGDGECEC